MKRKNGKKVTIVVVEDNRRAWIRLCAIVEALGYGVDACLVYPDDRCEIIAWSLRRAKPDIVLLDDHLTRTIRGTDVIKELGGEFYKPDIPGGNPRVISISSDPSEDMLRFSCGGKFWQKDSILSPEQENWRESVQPLIDRIELSVKQLGLRV